MSPNKIFIPENLDWPSAAILTFGNKPGDVEYIRKDALLEWLRKEYETIFFYYEKMKNVTGCVGDTSSSGKAEAYKNVIDKIESL